MDKVANVFGAYDIRGIAGETIDADFARKLGRAFANFLCPSRPGNFLVGHDPRTSSPELAAALIEGIIRAGHNVCHIGLASTPMVYWWGAEKNFDGSISVTASHLSGKYNGFKLSRRNAVCLSSSDGLKEIERNMNLPESNAELGFATMDGEALKGYVHYLDRFLRIKGHLNIAIDAGHGAAGPEISLLFKNHDDLTLNGIGLEPDGRFPSRSPNPLDKGALDRLSKLVVDRGCRFGAAFDGDADRIVVVDEQGKMIAPDILTSLIAIVELKKHPGAKILFDLRSSRAVAEAIESLGGIAVKTRVGHSYIKKTMRQLSAPFAGELSGHYYFADLHYSDNALRVLLELMNLLAETKEPLSKLVAPLSKYAGSGEINLQVADAINTLEQLESNFPDGQKDHLDGLSVDYPDWWFNARSSQTEPVLRLTVEAANEASLKQHVEHLLSLLQGGSN